MKGLVRTYNENQEKLSSYCRAIGNPTRIAIMESVAIPQKSEADSIEIAGLSKYTVGVNLKALKRLGLIKGTFGAKKNNYHVDYKKLEEFKFLFDDFYKKLTQNKKTKSAE